MTEKSPANDGSDVSDDDRKRFEELFNKLDTNKDGTIDVRELAASLSGRKDAHGQAEVRSLYYSDPTRCV